MVGERHALREDGESLAGESGRGAQRVDADVDPDVRRGQRRYLVSALAHVLYGRGRVVRLRRRQRMGHRALPLFQTGGLGFADAGWAKSRISPPSTPGGGRTTASRPPVAPPAGTT